METLHNWQTTLLSSTPSILSTSTKETTMIQCAHLHPNYRGAYRFQRCTFSPIIPLRCATHTINIQSILTKFNNQSTFFIPQINTLYVFGLIPRSITMATIISCSALPSIRASSGSIRKPDPTGKKPGSWWAPLFGWSSEPDYVKNNNNSSSASLDLDVDKTTRRCLTEEKAKQLRMKIAQVSTFHEVMYHSAIASRLASDVSVRVNE